MKLFSQKHEYDGNERAASALSEPLIVLPGLFGSTSNWRSMARQLSQLGDVVVLDQRNHGRSDHADSQSYADMVDDLLTWMDDESIQRAHLMGHSMGGKVAMCATHWHTERFVSLSVLDIAPVKYSHSHAPFIDALLALDLSQLSGRAEADEALHDAIPDKGTRLFLLQSLSGASGRFKWRLNLPVLREYMPEIIDFPDLNTQVALPTLVLYGAQSSYVGAEHHVLFERLYQPLTMQRIEGAGHWLHVEQPKEVLEGLMTFLRDL